MEDQPHSHPKNTTRGGVQRTKFVPNLAAAASRRPVKQEEEPSNGTKTPNQTTDAHGRGGRGRGRGRAGGRGASSNTVNRGGLLSGPVVISGPFAHGPAAALKKQRDSALVSTFQDLNKGGSVVSLNSKQSRATEIEDEIQSLEEVLSIRNPRDHNPISLKPLEKSYSNSRTSDLNEFTPKDFTLDSNQDELLQTGKLMLFQFPSCLPSPVPLDTDDTESSIQTISQASLLMTDETEKVLDIETFQKANTPNFNNKQNRKPKWPKEAEGLYGVLRCHASGKVSLLVNGMVFDAIPSILSSDISSCRRAVAIDADYGQSFDLGQINRQIVFAPDLEQILSMTKLDDNKV